jgi:hypothetical protein
MEEAMKTSKLDTLETREEFREAIGTLATAITRLQEQVALLTALVDLHQRALEAHGLVKRKPERPGDVN